MSTTAKLAIVTDDGSGVVTTKVIDGPPFDLSYYTDFVDDGGWDTLVGTTTADIAVADKHLTVEKTDSFAGDAAVVQNSDVPSLAQLNQCGHPFFIGDLTLDQNQGSAMDTSVNAAALAFMGSEDWPIAIALLSDGDGAGGATVQGILLDTLTGNLGGTPFPLGNLVGLTDWQGAIGLIDTGPLTFDAYGYIRTNSFQLQKVGEFRGLLKQNYGFQFTVGAGVRPSLISDADTEAAPHVHKFSNLRIFMLPVGAMPDGPRPNRMRQESTATTNLLTTDNGIDFTAANTVQDCQLPLLTSYDDGREAEFKDSSFTAATDNKTITPDASQKIDNGADGAPYTINADGGFVKLRFNGSRWLTVG